MSKSVCLVASLSLGKSESDWRWTKHCWNWLKLEEPQRRKPMFMKCLKTISLSQRYGLMVVIVVMVMVIVATFQDKEDILHKRYVEPVIPVSEQEQWEQGL